MLRVLHVAEIPHQSRPALQLGDEAQLWHIYSLVTHDTGTPDSCSGHDHLVEFFPLISCLRFRSVSIEPACVCVMKNVTEHYKNHGFSKNASQHASDQRLVCICESALEHNLQGSLRSFQC